ncbi:MAG: basic amino acid ABC transporter substrate-binding protein [Rubrivivax sp.]|nr:basic amino acid ABC transporter substrate-binding protein [Rubrivivax sp.]
MDSHHTRRRALGRLLSGLALGGAWLLPAQAQDRVLVVGTGSTFRPFGFVTPDRKIVGFDIDVMNAIAAQQGMKLRYESTPFSAIFPALENGDRDIVVAAVTNTAARRERADFSNPYMVAQLSVLLGPGVSAASLNELRSRRVGVALNSTADTAVSEAFGKTASNVRRFENTPLMLEELNQGGVDAAVGDVSVLSFYQRNNPEKRFRLLADARFPQAYLGIVVKKGNKPLLDRINAGLRQVIDSGEYARIHLKWFGTAAPPLPASIPG